MEDHQDVLPACYSDAVTFDLLSDRPLLSLLMRHSHVSSLTLQRTWALTN